MAQSEVKRGGVGKDELGFDLKVELALRELKTPMNIIAPDAGNGFDAKGDLRFHLARCGEGQKHSHQPGPREKFHVPSLRKQQRSVNLTRFSVFPRKWT